MAAAEHNPNLNSSRERVLSAAVVEDDSSFDLKLRPQRLAEFIGQKRVKENLAVAIEAARSRGEAMDHVLLYGPPGLGKTTLANIIANELGVHFQPTAAPLLQIKGDLTAIITNMQDKQVLFIDEIHRLQPVLEELLYSALEDYKLDIIIGQGPSARTHTLEVKPFTFARKKSPAVPGALPESRTASCGGCATTLRCAAPAKSTRSPQRRRWRCWKSTSMDSMR